MKNFCHRVAALCFSISLFAGCQTYTNQNQNIRNAMYEGNFTGAIKDIDSSSLSKEGRNYALFNMEKGMLLYLNQQYDEATGLWVLADKKLDDLYTVSISKTAASFIINDSMSDYTGEAHERVLIPIFASMAFFAQGNINNSQVMIRRTNDIIHNLQSENQGKNTFKYDAFSHYFSGMVFEAKADWDSAIIEYNLALKNFNASTVNLNNEEARNEILKALGRLAQWRSRKDILKNIRKISPDLKWETHQNMIQNGEVYIIYEAGKSPIKTPENIVITIPPSQQNAAPTTARISFPKYIDLPYSNRIATVLVNGQYVTKTIVMEDIGQMAKEALEDRRVRDLAKMTARVVAKTMTASKLNEENPLVGFAASVFNVATEVADTRSWTSLPDNLQIARIPVPANKVTDISIQTSNGLQQTFTVNLQPGEKKLYRFRTFN